MQSAVGINNPPCIPVPVEEASPSLQLALFTLSCGEEGRGNSGSCSVSRVLPPNPVRERFSGISLFVPCRSRVYWRKVVLSPTACWRVLWLWGQGTSSSTAAWRWVVFVSPWSQVWSKCFWTTMQLIHHYSP